MSRYDELQAELAGLRNRLRRALNDDDYRRAILMAADRTADPDNDHRCQDCVARRDEQRRDQDD
jgi:hypothetical protein